MGLVQHQVYVFKTCWHHPPFFSIRWNMPEKATLQTSTYKHYMKVHSKSSSLVGEPPNRQRGWSHQKLKTNQQQRRSTSSSSECLQVSQSSNRTAADPPDGVGLKKDPLHATTRNNYINDLHRDGSPRKGLATATCAMCPADTGLQSYELSIVFLP